MKGSTSIGLISTAALLAGPGRIYAQEADIKAAIGAYHAALESLDMNKAAPLWAHDAGVTLINPAGKIAFGWDTVNRPTAETDVFENRGGTWLLLSHAASGCPAQQ
jgi:hypothetical protein